MGDKMNDANVDSTAPRPRRETVRTALRDMQRRQLVSLERQLGPR